METHMKANGRAHGASESGFTLVEVLIAMVVFMFGIIAVANLMIVAGTSNRTARESTAAAAVATEVIERLKSIPYPGSAPAAGELATGGNLTADSGSLLNCNDGSVNCVVAGNFNARRTVTGVGEFKTRWTVTQGGDPQVMFIVVRTESANLIGRQRSRAEFTVFRSCTSQANNCPANP
jgi:prepilin-type N-terminal cleavage/methylation domain-containing protein